jgi:hypothetical protein
MVLLFVPYVEKREIHRSQSMVSYMIPRRNNKPKPKLHTPKPFFFAGRSDLTFVLWTNSLQYDKHVEDGYL